MADFDAIYLAGGSAGATGGAVGGAHGGGSELEEGAAILTQDHSELDGGPPYSNTLQLVPDPIVIRGAGNITV